jgi:hypothetical protein
MKTSEPECPTCHRPYAALSASGAGEEEPAAIRLLREVYQTHRSPDHYEYEAEPCDWCRAVAPILAASATTTETKT